MWLYGAVVMGGKLSLHAVLASLGPLKSAWLNLSLVMHFSYHNETTLGNRVYGFPTLSIISKCLSWFFNTSLSLVQLVSR